MEAASELFALDLRGAEVLALVGFKHARDRMRTLVPGPCRPLVRPRTFGLRGRSEPISEEYGWDRGTPIDRYYIEQFLAEHRADIRGRVLEIKEPMYATRLASDVERVDVLDIDPQNDGATLIADLADGDGLPADTFDCFLLTQTLQYIPSIERAIANAHRLLAPGGVVLATIPSLGKVTDDPYLSDQWRLTSSSARRLFAGAFGVENVTVRSHGNSVAAAGFLLGYAMEELRRLELETHDERYPVIVSVRALKR